MDTIRLTKGVERLNA